MSLILTDGGLSPLDRIKIEHHLISAAVRSDKGSGIQIAAWRELEWRRCSRDPVYFIETYGWIKLKDGSIAPFELWPVQKRLIADWSANISTLAVKAHQLGITTLSAHFAFWEVMFKDASEWNLFGATEIKAGEIVERTSITRAWLPNWMLDRARERNIEEGRKGGTRDNDARFSFRAGFSKMLVLAATVRNIAGASGSLIYDEFPRWEDQEDKYRAGLPVTDGGGLTIIIGNGQGNDFFRMLFDKAERGENKFKAYFFDWMEDPTRLTGSYIEMSDGSRKNVTYANKDEAMEAHLKGKLVCPWYAEAMRNFFVQEPESDEYAFKAKYPSTKEEAFYISGRSRFPMFWVNQHSHRIALETEEMARKHPDMPWPDRGFLEWHTKEENGKQTKEVVFTHRAGGRLRVWERPQSARSYVVSGDPAGGRADGDYAVADVGRVDAVDKIVQVAQFQSKMEPTAFAAVMEMLCLFYNDALAIPERNNHGHAVISLMKQTYFNIYTHVDESSRMSDIWSDNLGYPQDKRTKTMAIDGLAEWLDCGSLESPKEPMLHLRSPITVAELGLYEIRENGSTGAPKGQNDDAVVSAALLVVGGENLNLSKEIEKVVYEYF